MWLDKDNRDCNRYGTTSDITLPYNTGVGYLASTTKNISGIYDMSGGSWEFMMAVMTDKNGTPLSGRNASNHSGFVGPYGEGGSLSTGYSWPDSRYYEKYTYSTSYGEYKRGKLGDATTEMGPFKRVIYANNVDQFISSWYSANSHFVYSSYPWFLRGGDYRYGVESGMYTFGPTYGSIISYIGFRVVLIP